MDQGVKNKKRTSRRIKRADPNMGIQSSMVVDQHDAARTGRAKPSRPITEANTKMGEIGAFRAQHLNLERRQIRDEFGSRDVVVDDGESPLAWLAKRKGRDGRLLIEPVQLLAGERLRGEFTCANLMPRITANWSASVAAGAGGASAGTLT
jgi:hypothetical protein